MSKPVFIVSEWLAKPNHEKELWDRLRELMALTAKEKGCVKAHTTRQIMHPSSPSLSNYPIVLLQEYVDKQAFDAHCDQDYVKDFFKKYIENKEEAIVDDWRCRLFGLDES